MQSKGSNQRIAVGRSRGRGHREMINVEWPNVNQHQRNIGRARGRGLIYQELHITNQLQQRNIGRAGRRGLIQRDWQQGRLIPVHQNIPVLSNSDQNITHTEDWDLSWDVSPVQFSSNHPITSNTPVQDAKLVDIDQTIAYSDQIGYQPLEATGDMMRSKGRGRGKGLIHQDWQGINRQLVSESLQDEEVEDKGLDFAPTDSQANMVQPYGKCSDVDFQHRDLPFVDNVTKDSDNTVWEPMPLLTCLSDKYRYETHVAHCMLWFRTSNSIYHNITYAFLQLRYDGLLGFPGGIVDEDITSLESIINGLQREMMEEINYRHPIGVEHYVYSYYCPMKRMISHFFAKEISHSEAQQVEKCLSKARDFPLETLGLMRTPIGVSHFTNSWYLQRFMNNFMKQKFVGITRKQMIDVCEQFHIMSPLDLTLVKAQL